jgi:hypothetical protein
MGRGSGQILIVAMLVLTGAASAEQGGSGRARTSPATGLWSVTSARSEASAAPTLTARLASESAVDGTAHPELVFRCRERVFEAYVDTKVISSGVGNRVRWDDAPALVYDVWSEPDSDAQTLFTPEPEDFLRKAMRARRLRFEFKPNKGGAAVASFQLAGISGVVIRLQEACPTLVALH